MNKNIVMGNWKELKGKVQHQWGKLTDDELDKISGTFLELEGVLQKKYGYSQDEAEEEIKEFCKKSNVKIDEH